MKAILWFLLFATMPVVQAQPFTLRLTQPTLDRWMYPFNATPGCRATAPVFGTLGDDAGVDSRHGQFLVGFDTVSQTVTNCGGVSVLPDLLEVHQGASNYLVSRATVTLTIQRDRAFLYDPTQDAFTSFLEADDPLRTGDLDPGRPIELFGVGFRNGYTVETFPEDAPFGNSATGRRNAFAACYGPAGLLIDVSNNVGKTNSAFTPFEVFPFALGETSEVTPGDPVPAESRFTFDLHLNDPLVRQYVQEGLNTGHLRFMLTALHTSSNGGPPGWPDFYTRDSVLGQPPTFEIEGTIVRPIDKDNDGLPDDWEQFHFGNLEATSDEDSDADGSPNGHEFSAGTDPRDAFSTLRLVSMVDAVNGGITLHFPATASHHPIIEQSTDLRVWTAIENPSLTFLNASGMVEWRNDQFQAQERTPRFYRIRTP